MARAVRGVVFQRQVKGMAERRGNLVPYGRTPHGFLVDDGVETLLAESKGHVVSAVVGARDGGEALRGRIEADVKEAPISAFAGSVDELLHDVRS